MNKELLRLEKVKKTYGDITVLENYDLTVCEGERLAIAGASGEGKTTILRLILNLEQPDTGLVERAEGIKVRAVFQEDRLSENVTAYRNVAIAAAPSVTGDQLEQMFRTLELEQEMHRKARELSGGQKRRVALLRALAAPWNLLLLDEPFTGLDEESKKRAMDLVNACLSERTDAALILVTHDSSEIDYLSCKRSAAGFRR